MTRRLVTNLLDVLGGSLIVIGLALYNVPVALIAAGLICLVGSWRNSA